MQEVSGSIPLGSTNLRPSGYGWASRARGKGGAEVAERRRRTLHQEIDLPSSVELRLQWLILHSFYVVSRAIDLRGITAIAKGTEVMTNIRCQSGLAGQSPLLGAVSLGILALSRGETINAVWLVSAAICILLSRLSAFTACFIAERVLRLDPSRLTPAQRFNDGLDYCPTDKTVLFGHHFAAIAGAGPLVGPVLAAQMGYLPGTLWLIAGVVFAGAVQDFIVLWASTRRDGRSLGDMIRAELGELAGTIAMIGVLLIMVILLAVLALVVVKALKQSPWATFTVMMTIPIAVLMGIYGRYIRPGRIGEMSLIGFALLMLSHRPTAAHVAADPVLGPMFNYTGEQLSMMLIAYGFVAPCCRSGRCWRRATISRRS